MWVKDLFFGVQCVLFYLKTKYVQLTVFLDEIATTSTACDALMKQSLNSFFGNKCD